MSTGIKAFKGPKASKDHKPLKDPNQNRELNRRAQENCVDLSGITKRPKIEKKAVLVPMASANGPENVSARNKGKKIEKKKKKSKGGEKTSKGLWSGLVHCQKKLQ